MEPKLLDLLKGLLARVNREREEMVKASIDKPNSKLWSALHDLDPWLMRAIIRAEIAAIPSVAMRVCLSKLREEVAMDTLGSYLVLPEEARREVEDSYDMPGRFEALGPLGELSDAAVRDALGSISSQAMRNRLGDQRIEVVRKIFGCYLGSWDRQRAEIHRFYETGGPIDRDLVGATMAGLLEPSQVS